MSGRYFQNNLHATSHAKLQMNIIIPILDVVIGKRTIFKLLVGTRLYGDLHAAARTENEMQSALFLDVVI